MPAKKRKFSSPPSRSTRSRKCVQKSSPPPFALSCPIFGGVLEKDIDRINLGIDFGTSSCAAYSAIVPKDSTDPLEVKPIRLDLHQTMSVIPAYVALKPIDETKNARLVFGRAVNTATELDEISWEDVWLDIKQANFLMNLDELPTEKRESITKLHQQHERILEKAKDYENIFLSHEWMEEEKAVKLNKMEDVVDKLLRFFLMEIKTAVWRKAMLSKEDVDLLLSGCQGKKYGDRVRVGVAIPEIWTWQRMIIYQLLRNAGFHENLELLSEGRCALAKGLTALFESRMRRKEANEKKILDEMKERVFLGIDDGGYTLDGAIMELVQSNSLVKLAVIGEGQSSQDGSNRANDIFKSRVSGFFGPHKLPDVLKEVQVPESVFELNLERGFEATKCELVLADKERAAIVYKGVHAMNKNSNRSAVWAGKGLRIDRDAFLEILQAAIDEKFATAGPIPKLYDQAVAVAKGRSIHVIFSGGGSKSPLLIRQATEYSKMREVRVSFDGTGSASCVAEGACIVLSDPDLSRDIKKSRKSYGIVITEEYDVNSAVHKLRLGDKTPMEPHFGQEEIAGREDMPRTVVWKTLLNHPVRFQMEERAMQQTIWTENDGRDDPENASDDWEFELELMWSSGIKFDRKIASFIGRKQPFGKRSHGFHQGTDGLWRLDFHYVLSYQWRGMLQYFEVKIPKHGALQGDKVGEEQAFKRWEFWEKAEWKNVGEKWDSMRIEA